jgi:hypothetical protein
MRFYRRSQRREAEVVRSGGLIQPWIEPDGTPVVWVSDDDPSAWQHDERQLLVFDIPDQLVRPEWRARTERRGNDYRLPPDIANHYVHRGAPDEPGAQVRSCSLHPDE